MKLVTPFAVTLSSIIMALTLAILNSFHLYGLDFINAIIPTCVLCVSVFYSYILSNALVEQKEARYKALYSGFMRYIESSNNPTSKE